MSHITKTAWIISVFNTICCIIFFAYKYMVFYGYVNITTKGEQDRYKIVSRTVFNPNRTDFFTADIHFIFEVTAYFLGILFNALLPLGVNTAEEKNAFFFFPGYYISSFLLSIMTFLEGFRFGLLPYIGYSVINLILLVVVGGIHRALLNQKRDAKMYNGRKIGWVFQK